MIDSVIDFISGERYRRIAREEHEKMELEALRREQQERRCDALLWWFKEEGVRNDHYNTTSAYVMVFSEMALRHIEHKYDLAQKAKERSK